MGYFTLNGAGMARVARWLSDMGDTCRITCPESLFNDAENAANNAAHGDAVTLEIRGLYMLDGNPRTVTLDAIRHFDMRA